MTFGTLCSGIGGADLGLLRLGWGCAWQVERDPFKAAVLAEHWPKLLRCADVEDAADLPPVDLVHCEPQAPEPWAVDPVLRWVRAARPQRIVIGVATGHEASRSYGDIFWTLYRSGYSVSSGIIQYASGVRLNGNRVAVNGRSMMIIWGVRGAAAPVVHPELALALGFGDVNLADATVVIDEEAIPADDLERARGFPLGWACLCGATPCRCGAARINAVREATAPPFAAYVCELVMKDREDASLSGAAIR